MHERAGEAVQVEPDAGAGDGIDHGVADPGVVAVAVAAVECHDDVRVEPLDGLAHRRHHIGVRRPTERAGRGGPVHARVGESEELHVGHVDRAGGGAQLGLAQRGDPVVGTRTPGATPPASPRVAHTTAVRAPAAAACSRIEPQPNVSSSGWATTTARRVLVAVMHLLGILSCAVFDTAVGSMSRCSMTDAPNHHDVRHPRPLSVRTWTTYELAKQVQRSLTGSGRAPSGSCTTSPSGWSPTGWRRPPRRRPASARAPSTASPTPAVTSCAAGSMSRPRRRRRSSRAW